MKLIALTAVLCLFSGAARADLVTVRTAAGPITIASDVAHKFTALIDDLVAHGFHGRVHCFAAHGHVKHSLHHTGRACDFAQTGWNRTVRPMYSSTALIQAHGLRDGCTFRHPRKDCGHVDAGLSRTPRTAFASHTVTKLWAYGQRHKVVAHIERHVAASSGWWQPQAQPEVRHHRGHHRMAAHHHRDHHRWT